MGTYYHGVLFYGVDITNVIPDNNMNIVYATLPENMEVVVTGCHVTEHDSRYFVAFKQQCWDAYEDTPIDLGNLSQKLDIGGGYDELYEFCQSLGVGHPDPKIYLGCWRG